MRKIIARIQSQIALQIHRLRRLFDRRPCDAPMVKHDAFQGGDLRCVRCGRRVIEHQYSRADMSLDLYRGGELSLAWRLGCTGERFGRTAALPEHQRELQW